MFRRNLQNMPHMASLRIGGFYRIPPLRTSNLSIRQQIDYYGNLRIFAMNMRRQVVTRI